MNRLPKNNRLNRLPKKIPLNLGPDEVFQSETQFSLAFGTKKESDWFYSLSREEQKKVKLRILDNIRKVIEKS